MNDTQSPAPGASETTVDRLMQLAQDYADEAINHGLYAPATYEARDRLREAIAAPLPAQVRVDAIGELGVRVTLKVDGVTALENGGLGVVVELPKQIGEMKCWIHDCKTVEQCAESGCALRTPAPGMAGGVGTERLRTLLEVLKDGYQSAAAVSGSKLLSGERCKNDEQKPLVYRKACEALQALYVGVDEVEQMLAAPHPSPAPQAAGAVKLWLWKNFVDGKPEYWAFDNPFPINLGDGDPQTLGQPCGYAIFKPSRQGRTDVSEERVLRDIAGARSEKPNPPTERDGLTSKEAWWAGYREGKGLPPDTPRRLCISSPGQDGTSDIPKNFREFYEASGKARAETVMHDFMHKVWVSAMATLSPIAVEEGWEVTSDARRLQYLTADMPDSPEKRERDRLLNRMCVMSHAAICAEIDAAITASGRDAS